MWTRRSFLRAGATTTLGGLAVGGYTWRIEPHWLELRRLDLPLPDLPADLEGATVVQLSDLHVGRGVDSEYLTGVLDRVRALDADVVVFTGDFVSFGDAHDLDELARVLEAWPHGRRGTFAVLGNHDYGASWRQAEVGDRVASLARDAGIEVLRNEGRRVDGLTVVGLDDLWADRFRPEAVTPGLASEGPTLALVHNPDAADRPGWGGFRGWILSGHTHGGQCKPPFLPPPLLPVANRRYTSGAFRLDDRRTLYVNRGVGHLLRVRFNARPEATVFTLRRA